MPQSAEATYQSQALFGNGQYTESTFQNDLNHHPPDDPQSGFDAFDLDHELLMPDTGQHLDISEFLMSDLDRSNQHNGGVSGDGQGSTGGVNDGGGDTGENDGGGGCCCR